MTTFTYDAVDIFVDPQGNPEGAAPSTISVSTAGGRNGIQFVNFATLDGDPLLEVTGSGVQSISLNSLPIEYYEAFGTVNTTAYEIESGSGTSQVLSIVFAAPDNSYVQTFLRLSGDPLPALGTAAEVRAYFNSITSFEPLDSGPFAPGNTFALGSVASLAVRTEADQLFGTPGDDVFSGGQGDDLFLIPGEGTDRVDGGGGTDALALFSFDESESLGDTTIDLDAGTASFATATGTVSFSNIEAVALDIDFMDTATVTGSSGDDTLILTLFDGELTYDGRQGTDELDLSGITSMYVDGAEDGLSLDEFGAVLEFVETGAGQYDIRLTQDGINVATLNSVETVRFASGDGSVLYGIADLADGTATPLPDPTGPSPDPDPVAPDPAPNPGDVITDAGGGTLLTGTAADDTINAGGGNDTIRAGDGQDLISGGIGFDLIEGGAGNDTIDGLDGFDTIDGGAGRDVLAASAGNDVVRGGAGNDLINGGIGFDTLFGNDGDDLIEALDGFDVLYAGAGTDTLYGNAGNDTLYGGAGDSVLNGGIANDALIGGTGNEVLNANAGADSLTGNGGDDTLRGNAGKDTLAGGTGTDMLVGGVGRDVFVFNDGDGRDTVVDMGVVDRAEIDRGLFAAGTGLGDYGTRIDGNFALDFGGGDVLIFQGVDALAQVAGAIDLV